MLEKLLDHVTRERKVIKSVPMRAAWAKGREELKVMRKELEALKAKYESKGQLYWASIEKELDFYGDLQYNEETDEMELLADDEDASTPEAKLKKAKKSGTVGLA